MPRYVVDQKCFVGNKLRMPGEVFDFDGPEGAAFHLVGQPAKPKISDERMMDAAIREHKPWEAEKAKLLSEIDELKNAVALLDQANKEFRIWESDKAQLLAEILRLNDVIAEKNQVIRRTR